MNRLNFNKENCLELAKMEGETDIDIIPYTITGYGVGHIKASDLLKSKKIKDKLHEIKGI